MLHGNMKLVLDNIELTEWTNLTSSFSLAAPLC